MLLGPHTPAPNDGSTWLYGTIGDPRMVESVSTQLIGISAESRDPQARIGLDTIIVVADAIAADARFNMWFASVVKEQARDEEQVIELLEELHEASEACSHAIRRFAADRDHNPLKAAIEDYTTKLLETTRHTVLR
jgi:membrane-bound lytic murein transglycosylase B